MALIVTVVVPVVAFVAAENATVTVQVGLHGLLVKIALTPAGRDEAENVIAVVEPLVRVAVIIDVELVEPTDTDRLLGEGVERLKSNAAAVTTRRKVAVRVTPPPIA